MFVILIKTHVKPASNCINNAEIVYVSFSYHKCGQLTSESLSCEYLSADSPSFINSSASQHFLPSFLVPGDIGLLALTTAVPLLMLWLGPSDGQEPGALRWALGGRRPLEWCGRLIGVVCVFLTGVWGVVLGVDWHVNIQRVHVCGWNLKRLAKCFFICWWRLEWNVTKGKSYMTNQRCTIGNTTDWDIKIRLPVMAATIQPVKTVVQWLLRLERIYLSSWHCGKC